MAKSILDIIIKTVKQGGADKETVQSLVSVKSAITNTVGAAGLLIGAGASIKKMFDESVGSLVEYANQVRTVQNATGASAEDSSKLIQILDDQKISYETLTKAIAKNSKEYDFSINGIANMSDEYLRLRTSQEKATFMQERFGKSWVDFVPVMQKGKQAILDAADATSGSLVLTQQSIDATRRLEVAQDSLSDAIEGAKIAAGEKIVPWWTDVLNGINIVIEAHRLMREENFDVSQAFEVATRQVAYNEQQLLKNAEAMREDTEAAKANEEQIKATTDAHKSMLGIIVNIAGEFKNHEQRQADLTEKMQENRAEAEKLYPWQKQQLEELDQKYVEMQDTYNENAAAHNAAMGKIQYDLLITKLSVDGLTDAEFMVAQQAGLMFGVFDQRSVQAAQHMNAVAEAVSEGKLKVEDMDAALRRMEKGYSIDIVLKTISQITGGTHISRGSAAEKAGIVSGFQHGGISTGPQSGHMELLHGTEAVIPLEGGAVPVKMQGGAGVNVYLTISSPVTILDQQSAKNTLLPFIEAGIREAKSRGSI